MSEKWSDLQTRLISGAAMVVVGAIGIWLGELVFHLLVALVCGLMVWELVGILVPGRRDMQLTLGGATGAALFLSILLPIGLGLPLLLAPVFYGFSQLSRERTIYLAFSAMILLAGYGLMQVRDDLGAGWLLWIVLIVVVTDVVGYFAGRMIGGPKFWPKVSPKKTWSGTASGWVGAAIVGLIFAAIQGVSFNLVGLSVAIAMASQLGDIAESGMKRKFGVKDSSDLIPGHGGLMDRFDGMLGAAVFLLIIGPLVGFPGGLG